MSQPDQIVDPLRARSSSGTRMVLDNPSLADAFWRGTGEFLHATQLLDAGFADTTPEYVLLMHATELGLKAYLARKGLSEKEIKAFGHDLVKLFDRTQQLGLALNFANAREMIEWLNEWHSDRAIIRYDFSSNRTLPPCTVLFPLVEEIIRAGKKSKAPRT